MSDETQTQTRTVCGKCGMLFGGFHKGCDGTWVEQTRTVTAWVTTRIAPLSWSAASPQDRADMLRRWTQEITAEGTP